MHGFATAVRSSSLAGSPGHVWAPGAGQVVVGGPLGLRPQQLPSSGVGVANGFRPGLAGAAPPSVASVAAQHAANAAGLNARRTTGGILRRPVAPAPAPARPLAVHSGRCAREAEACSAVVGASKEADLVGVRRALSPQVVAGRQAEVGAARRALSPLSQQGLADVAAAHCALSPHQSLPLALPIARPVAALPGDGREQLPVATAGSAALAHGDVAAADEDDDVFLPSRALFSASKKVLLIATINFLFRSIDRGDFQVADRMPNTSTFQAFQEPQYHESKEPNAYLDPFTRTLLDASAGHVAEFVLMLLHRGYFDVSEFIVSVLYLARFKDITGIPLHVSAWRPMFVTALLLADKMWEDKSVKNSSLTMLFPVLSNAELFDLEVRFLEWLGFSAWISRSDFQSFCEGLLRSEAVSPEICEQVLASEYMGTLQEGQLEAAAAAPSSEAPSSPPASAPASTPASAAMPAGPPAATNGIATAASGKANGVRPDQPWNVRKTLHAYSPTRTGFTAMCACTAMSVHNTDGSCSPRRLQQHVGPVGWPSSLKVSPSGSTAIARNRSHDRNSLAAVATAVTAPTPSPRPPGTAAALPSGPHGPLAERRPLSEPRLHPLLGSAANGRASGSCVITALSKQQLQQQWSQAQMVRQMPGGSPRHDRLAPPRDQAAGGMPSERGLSEPAGVRMPQQSAVTRVVQAQAPSMAAQSVQHSRSSSAVATGAQVCSSAAEAAQQRVIFPFGPASRSTVPIPGPARTSRVFQPPLGGARPLEQQLHAAPGGAQLASLALLRGRSSSPAGVGEGALAQPPSARRNVAAPPPTIRPGGLRFG